MERASRLKKSKKEMLPLFIRGLTPQLKLYVLAREPADLDTAFNLAKAGESLEIISDLTVTQNNEARSVRFPGEIGRVTQTNNTLDVSGIMNELKNLGDKVNDMKRKNNVVRYDNVDRKPTMRCYHCGNPGHRIGECRTRLRQMQNVRQVRSAHPIRGYQAPPYQSARPWQRPPTRNMPSNQGN